MNTKQAALVNIEDLNNQETYNRVENVGAVGQPEPSILGYRFIYDTECEGNKLPNVGQFYNGDTPATFFDRVFENELLNTPSNQLAEQLNPLLRPVPSQVTMRQARLALLNAGLLNAVEPAIATIPNDTERKSAEITWEYSAEVMRNNVLISALAKNLGLSDTDLDNLFKVAATL